KADLAKGHVRFTPKSRHVRCTSSCLLWANSGHNLLLEHRVGHRALIFAGLRQTEGAKDIAITLAIMSVYQWRGAFDPSNGIVRLELACHCYGCPGFVAKI